MKALFEVTTSNKIETSMRLEQSTVKMLNRYAHFHKAAAEDTVDRALQYIFEHDKAFQQDLAAKPDETVTETVRVQAVAEAKAPRVRNRAKGSTTSTPAK